MYGIIDPEYRLPIATYFAERYIRLVGKVRSRLISKLRPAVNKALERAGLQWEDVEPFIDKINSAEELELALQDPETFVSDMIAAGVESRCSHVSEDMLFSLSAALSGRCDWEEVWTIWAWTIVDYCFQVADKSIRNMAILIGQPARVQAHQHAVKICSQSFFEQRRCK